METWRAWGSPQVLASQQIPPACSISTSFFGSNRCARGGAQREWSGAPRSGVLQLLLPPGPGRRVSHHLGWVQASQLEECRPDGLAEILGGTRERGLRVS